MHLRITGDELATLIDMVSLAAEVSALNHKPNSQIQLERFAALEDRILERAAGEGFSEIIELDLETQRHRVTEDYQLSSVIQECLEEMRNEVFWEELAFRLGERDVAKEMGESIYLALSEEERQKVVLPVQQRYWEHFSKDGLNNLHQIAPHGEG